ncbi:MAG: c-type cytochrome [Verrucomicrobia bacterium]|nr:c-type cytochrome [Verrucomicrobiota bacterium]
MHRASGRIFKITYGEPTRPTPGDLAKLGARELAALHTHANEWFVRQARLELAARARAGGGVAEAIAPLRELFARHADVAVKLRALWSLYAMGATDTAFLRAQLRQVCKELLGVRALNSIAVRGLAQFDDPAIGQKIARSYRTFLPAEREGIVATLVARPAFARALLAEMTAGRIPRTALTPFHARQLRGYGDATLTRELAAIWGEAREPAADKRALIARLKTQLTPEALAQADKSKGRVVYGNLCASCHTLYGQGGRIGPDLTGSGRDNLDYVLENIADPSAVVGADYRLNVLTLRDGRTLSGFVFGKTAQTLTLNTTTEAVTVEHAEITGKQELSQSLMPEGLIESIPSDDAANLIAYLMHPAQVPLPADAR